jgi:acyl-coenzyme A synthetase/AMP-(fatty) acid ligase
MNDHNENYGYLISSLNAQQHPDKVAICYRGEQFTFDQFNRRVNRTANALATLGLRPGSKMAVLIHDAMPIAECYLALAKVGVTLVALNPYWDDEVMHAVLEHCDVQGFLFQQRDTERLAPIGNRLNPQIQWVQLEEHGGSDDTLSLEHARQKSTEDEPIIQGGGDDPMAFFFTSGTTGLPKAVVHTHNSCAAMAGLWDDLPYSEDSIWGTGPIIWGIGFPCTIGAALFVGMRVALEDDFGPGGLLNAIKQQAISHFCVIPSFWSDLLSNHDHQSIDLSSIKMILLGGEPLGTNLLNKIQARIPDAQLYAFYGQTEAPYTCLGRLDDNSQASNVVGKARGGCAARVLAPDGQAAIGAPGELAVSGPHCMQSYFNQPDKTAEALREGWFFSGDLATQDEQGRLTVLGRREDAIVRAGQYVQPLVVEDAALGIVGVTEAGAVSVDDGGKDQKILLALTAAEGVTEESILQQLQQQLPEYAVPDRIVLCDELPHSNDNSGGKGKLLRRKIRDDYGHLLTQ